MSRHYHYMNGSAGCLPDTIEVCRTRRDAIATAELLFDNLCERHFREMSQSLRSNAAKNGATYYFEDCDEDDCYAGADYVEITKEYGSLREDKYGELVCRC